MPEQPKVLSNLVIRMLWSTLSKAVDRSIGDKRDSHCLSPEVDHLLHAARRFRCCNTFGRQTGTALEGCATVNAANFFVLVSVWRTIRFAIHINNKISQYLTCASPPTK